MTTATANLIAAILIVGFAYLTAALTILRRPSTLNRSEVPAYWVIVTLALLIDLAITYRVLAVGIKGFLP